MNPLIDIRVSHIFLRNYYQDHYNNSFYLGHRTVHTLSKFWIDIDLLPSVLTLKRYFLCDKL